MVLRLEGFVMLWEKNNDIITVASQIIDKRVRLDEEKNGNHLIIGQATPEDSGAYTCQISAYKPTEITHNVIIRGGERFSLQIYYLSLIFSGAGDNNSTRRGSHCE